MALLRTRVTLHVQNLRTEEIHHDNDEFVNFGKHGHRSLLRNDNPLRYNVFLSKLSAKEWQSALTVANITQGKSTFTTFGS